MEWKSARSDDAARLAEFVNTVSDTRLDEEQAADFLGSWQVELAENDDSLDAGPPAHWQSL